MKKVANVQSQLSRLIEKNYYLNKSAREVRVCTRKIRHEVSGCSRRAMRWNVVALRRRVYSPTCRIRIRKVCPHDDSQHDRFQHSFDLVSRMPFLRHLLGEQAYRSYLLAYSSHSLKNIYDVHELDLQAVARAFGFTVPPRVSDSSLCAPRLYSTGM